MIEKLKVVLKPEDWKLPVDELEMCCLKNLLSKVDELVDAVNGILDYAPLEMAQKAEPKTPAENVQPDAETRPVNVLKWIRGDDDEVQRYAAVARGFKNLRKEPTDPYAEQRKWIGKLCKFWNDDGILDGVQYGELVNIWDTDDCPFQCGNGEWWEYCEPVKPDDDIIYKGE